MGDCVCVSTWCILSRSYPKNAPNDGASHQRHTTLDLFIFSLVCVLFFFFAICSPKLVRQMKVARRDANTHTVGSLNRSAIGPTLESEMVKASVRVREWDSCGNRSWRARRCLHQCIYARKGLRRRTGDICEWCGLNLKTDKYQMFIMWLVMNGDRFAPASSFAVAKRSGEGAHPSHLAVEKCAGNSRLLFARRSRRC